MNAKKPVADAKRATPAWEISKLEDYREKMSAVLARYADGMIARASGEADQSGNRATTYRGWAAAARKSLAALGDLDSAIAWKSVLSAPESPEDMAPILSGERPLDAEFGGPGDPIPFFVTKLRALEAARTAREIEEGEENRRINNALGPIS